MKFILALLLISTQALAVTYSTYPFGDYHWKSPSPTAGQLPVTGNIVGDARTALDTFEVYVWNGTSWSSGSGGGGTVSSVGLALPGIFIVSGSPVVGAGTLSATFSNESVNTFFSGPSSGSATTPSFRLIVPADIPTLNQDTTGTSSNVTGVVAVDHGGTNSSTALSNGFLMQSLGGSIVESSIAESDAADAIGRVESGNNGAFAGYDLTGKLYSIPGWFQDGTGQVQAEISPIASDNATSIQFNPDISTALTGGYEGVIVSPNLSSAMAYTSSFNAETNFSSGFNNSGETAQFQDQSQMQSGSTSGRHVSFVSSPTLGGTTGGYSGFSVGANINGTISGDLSAYQASPNVNVSIPGEVTTYGDFTNFNSTASTPFYQSAGFAPNLSAGSSIVTLNGINVNPNINGTISSEFTGINISPNGPATIPIIQGMNINLANLSSPVQKVGLDINDGMINVDSNIDTASLTLSGAFSNNDIGGQFQVSSGFPVNGVFGFGNDLSVNTIFNDNMGDDGTGLKLGFSINGLVNELIVAPGKVVESLNYMLAGGGVAPGSSGTINHAAMFYAAGFLNEGGTVVANELAGFKTSPILCSMASTCYSLFSQDTSAKLDNAGPVRFRTLTSGFVISDGSGNLSTSTNPTITGDLTVNNGKIESTQTTAPTAVVQAGAGTGASCSVSHATDVAGKVTITTGTLGLSTGSYCNVHFNSPYGVAPICQLTPASSTLSTSVYVTSTTTDAVVNFAVAGGISSTYILNYSCIETQ